MKIKAIVGAALLATSLTACTESPVVIPVPQVTVTAPAPLTGEAGYLEWIHSQSVPDTAELNDSALKMGYAFCGVLARGFGVDAATAAIESRGSEPIHLPNEDILTVRQIVVTAGDYLCPNYPK